MEQTRSTDAVLQNLRALYESCGYAQYKMSKFEEYDLYVRNKEFLISDSVITFTDTNGKLLALKPDVTLSIIKNGKDAPHRTQKVYYNENVYRISKGTHAFREIMQTGLECMGDLDVVNVAEVLLLACRSLQCISADAVLDVSHLGVVSAVLEKLSLSADVTEALVKCIGEKNTHEIRRLCQENNVPAAEADNVCALAALYGDPQAVLAQLETRFSALVPAETLELLDSLVAALRESGLLSMVRLDFSVVNNMKYYNGVVFQGFVRGVPHSVLSGGQYDRLMHRMHRTGGAIGFAVYLDAIERLWEDSRPAYDVETVVLYDETASPAALLCALEALRADGSRVCALREKPEKLRCRTLLKFKDGEVKPLD